MTYPAIPDGTVFVFEGDSKVSGPSTSEAFPAKFAALPVSSGIGAVHNVGVSGSKLSDCISRYNANVKPLAPAVLGIWIGTNDIFQLSALGYASPSAYYSALSGYVSQAVADGFRVMLFTVDARSDHLEPATEIARNQVNNLIRHSTDCEWIVDTEVLFNDRSDTLWWNTDGVHYIAEGYKRLARYIASVLLTYGSPPQTGVALTTKQNSFSLPQSVPTIYVNGAPGSAPSVHFMANWIPRFQIYLDSIPEAGGNEGSNLRIARYADNGSLLDQSAYSINRKTGVVST